MIIKKFFILLSISFFLFTNNIFANSICQQRHRRHRVTRPQQHRIIPENRDLILPGDFDYRRLLNWCRSNPQKCVRIGNNYFIMSTRWQ